MKFKSSKLFSLFLCLVLSLSVLTGCFEESLLQTEDKKGENSIESKVPETGDPDGVFTYEDIPAYGGKPYEAVNNNTPYFKESELTHRSFESYSDLDRLKRPLLAFASVGKDLMPTEDRESISSVHPAGWHSVRYDCVDGGSLYNRCHLIGFQLSGENANEKNLITGTRYLNVQGMLPFENMIADYVKETNHHVMYRVTPIYKGDNLLAEGVLMEGYSVEDRGEGISFCVFAYNVQPGIEIDYKTGASRLKESDPDVKPDDPGDEKEETFILNIKSKKFHRPDCQGVATMSDKNKQVFKGKRSELILMGYEPCKSCNP